MTGTRRSLLLLLALLAASAGGQEGRADMEPFEDGVPGQPAAATPCGGCGSSIATSIILTFLILAVVAILWWHLYVKKNYQRIYPKPDPETAARAAYDNPQFQGDDLDAPSDRQTKVPLPAVTVSSSQTKVASTATNTTGTLERGKTTLERVMAVIGGRSPRRTKDDMILGCREVTVPLQAQDFTGLGFSIQGSLKEGIFVKELSARGPASDSGMVMPGDKVTALTVLTENIVFEDACTILTYASPYPLLLHLEKGKGVAIPSPFKGKAPSATHSGPLIHPYFRSQSLGDLPKIGNLDIKTLKLGKLVPPSTKGKLPASFGLELPKLPSNFGLRVNETRHSERAIDVPGVEVRIPKPASVNIDIDTPDLDDNGELTSVQIHRPMSPGVDLERPDLTVIVPPFGDAELSGAGEDVKVLTGCVDIKGPKVNPKTKFGVKVFPDIGGGFKGQSRKDKLEGKDSVDGKSVDKKLEVGVGLNIEKPVFKIKKEGVKDIAPKKTSVNVKAMAPDVPDLKIAKSKIEVPEVESKKSGGKFGFDFGFKGFGKNDKQTDEDSSDKEAKQSKGSDSDDDRKKTKFGLKLDGPDIELPTFKKRTKKDSTSSNKSEKEENISTSDGAGFKIKGPKVDVPSASIDIKLKDNQKDSKKPNDSSESDFKLKGPSIHFPSFGFKSKSEEGDIESGGKIGKDVKSSKDKKSGAITVELEKPDIDLPSVSVKEDISSDEKESKHKKSTNAGTFFNMKTPNIDMPSFGFKSGSQKDGQEKPDVKSKDRKDSKEKDDSSDRNSFSIKAPNIELPSVSINSGSENKDDAKKDEESKYEKVLTEKKESSSGGFFQIKGPNIDLPSFSLRGSAKDDEKKDNKSNDEKEFAEKKESSEGNLFNIKGPSIDLPSLSFKSDSEKDESEKNDKSTEKDLNEHNDSDGKSSFKIKGPNIELPSFGFMSSSSTDGEKVKKDKKSHNDKETKEKKDSSGEHFFNIKAPSIDMPSFSFKSGSEKKDSDDKKDEKHKNDKDSKEAKEKDINLDLKISDPNIKMPKVDLKVKSKAEQDSKLDGPDINIPSLSVDSSSSKSSTLESEQSGDKGSSKHGFKLKGPHINIPSFGFGSKSKNDASKGPSEKASGKDGSREGSLDIEVNTPSVILPTAGLNLGKSSLNSESKEEKDDKTKVKSKFGFNTEGTSMNLPFGLKVKRKHSKELPNKPDISVDPSVGVDTKSVGVNLSASSQIPTYSAQAETIPNLSLDVSPKMDIDIKTPEITAPEVNTELIKESDIGDKVKKKSLFDLDINLPSFEFGKGKGNKPSDDDDKQDSDEIEVSKKLSDVEKKKEKLKKKTSSEGSGNLGFSIKAPEINFPSFEIKTDKETEEKEDTPQEDNDKKSKKDKKKSVKEKSGGFNFKFKGPDFNFPGFGGKDEKSLEGDKFKGDAEKATESESVDINVSAPKLSLSKPDLSADLKLDSAVDADIDIPEISDLNIKAEGVDFEADIGNIEVKSIEIEDNLKNLNYEGLNMQLPTPEVSLTGDLESREFKENESNDKSFGFNMKFPKMTMPSFGSDNDDNSQKKEDSSDIDISFNKTDIAAPKLEVSTNIELPSVDGNTNLDDGITIPKPDKHADLKFKRKDDSDSDSAKDKEGFSIKMPSFQLPSFGMKNDSSQMEASGSAKIESSQEVNVSNEEGNDSDNESGSKKQGFGFKIKMPNLKFDSPDESEATEYSLPDELKMEASNRNISDQVNIESGYSVTLPSLSVGERSSLFSSPEISPLDVSISDGTTMDINRDSGAPETPEDSEEIEEETAHGVNITDAIKKKRFGFKINPQSYSRPEFDSGTGSAQNNHQSDSDDVDKNQSDEMKSLNLRFRSPALSPSVDSGNFDSSLQEYNIVTDESKSRKFDLRVNVPDVKLEQNKASGGFSVTEPKFSIDSKNSTIVEGASLPNESDEWKIQGVSTADVKMRAKQFEAGLQMQDINVSGGAIKKDISVKKTEVEFPSWESRYRRSTDGNDVDENGKSTSIESTDLSFDSSMEVESDLPEADSDLKRAIHDLPEVDVEFPSADMNQENDGSSSNFGMAFGFKGFKKHIKIDGVDVDETEAQINHNVSIESNESSIENSLEESQQHTIEAINQAKMMGEDLPEADFTYNTPGHFDLGINVEEKNIQNNDYHNLSESDSEVESQKNEIKVDVELHPKFSRKEGENIDRKDSGDRSVKGKVASGFGLKPFVKSSDSEDTEAEGRISVEPDNERSHSKERKKRTFGFKGFGKSSSDTEEDSIEKVSENPMQKNEDGGKSKLKGKNSLTFGFKSKSSKNSDSEENNDIEKVDLDPHGEAGKKQKNKANINFGFKQRTKSTEEGQEQSEMVTETASKKEKTKQMKETKYDTKSESEGGEEDNKYSQDSKGEDIKGRSKYGLGFGFRRNSAKTTSDSEGADNEDQKVSLDTRGQDKSKEHKSKSLKLGFKGLKNLKGKIQTEINKMRHDSSDDDMEIEEEKGQGEKRKKFPKKKDKDKKIKREYEANLDVSDEAIVSSAALAAKSARRKKKDNTSSSSSSSSDSSSDEDSYKNKENKKKKKGKVRRKEEGRVVTTGVTDVELPDFSEATKVTEKVSVMERTVNLNLPNFTKVESSHVTVVRSEPNLTIESNYSTFDTDPMTKSPKRYVVVKEMKLKPSPSQDTSEVSEIVEKVEVKRNVDISFTNLQPRVGQDTDTDGGCYGSDSDMEKKQREPQNFSQTSVNITSSGKQKHLTDSEELKRKATSLGDLSQLHDNGTMSTVLERAVSLDFKNATSGPPALHVRRLHLPDSSATSIDEVEESSPLPSPKKLEISTALKSAGQWGTLEEALRYGQTKIQETVSSGLFEVETKTNNRQEGVSNIEISGGHGSSVTALSLNKDTWNESFEDENPPALPSSPIPIGTTTITVKENTLNFKNRKDSSIQDSNIIVVPANDIAHSLGTVKNVNVQLIQNPIHTETITHSYHGSLNSISSDSEMQSYSSTIRQSNEKEDTGGVTVTMVSAEGYPSTVVSAVPPPVPPKPHRNSGSSPELDILNYDNTSKVTVSHDWVKENGDMVVDSSELNISDDVINPDTSPLKSMTQITLDGGDGYTVTDGTMSRTVIISNPNSSNPVNIVQTDLDYSIPILRSPYEE